MERITQRRWSTEERPNLGSRVLLPDSGQHDMDARSPLLDHNLLIIQDIVQYSGRHVVFGGHIDGGLDDFG